MELLGHRDPRMTLRFQYPSSEHLGDAARALDWRPPVSVEGILNASLIRLYFGTAKGLQERGLRRQGMLESRGPRTVRISLRPHRSLRSVGGVRAPRRRTDSESEGPPSILQMVSIQALRDVE
jgi:hypothetical protein